jgi:hypothetical protein
MAKGTRKIAEEMVPDHHLLSLFLGMQMVFYL